MDEVEISSFFDYRQSKCKVIFNQEKVGYVEINPPRIAHETVKMDWEKTLELRDFLNACLDRRAKVDYQGRPSAL